MEEFTGYKHDAYSSKTPFPKDFPVLTDRHSQTIKLCGLWMTCYQEITCWAVLPLAKMYPPPHQPNALQKGHGPLL